jgi:hypothetical protein
MVNLHIALLLPALAPPAPQLQLIKSGLNQNSSFKDFANFQIEPPELTIELFKNLSF